MHLVDLGGSRVISVKMCPVIIWEAAQSEGTGESAQPELRLQGSESMAWHRVDARWQYTKTTGSMCQANYLGSRVP